MAQDRRTNDFDPRLGPDVTAGLHIAEKPQFTVDHAQLSFAGGTSGQYRSQYEREDDALSDSVTEII